MSRRSVYLRGQADACRELASTIGDADTQVELRKLADKFITRAVESKAKPGLTQLRDFEIASCLMRQQCQCPATELMRAETAGASDKCHED